MPNEAFGYHVNNGERSNIIIAFGSHRHLAISMLTMDGGTKPETNDKNPHPPVGS